LTLILIVPGFVLGGELLFEKKERKKEKTESRNEQAKVETIVLGS